MRKIIIDSKQFQKLVKVLKEQEEGEYYKISPQEYLDLLKMASYNPRVTGIKKFKGKPLYITGNLKLTGSDNTMSSLGNVAVVDGNLDASGVPLQTLGNVKVIGNLDISRTKISKLDGVFVKGWVHDYGTPIAAMRIRREELKKMGEAESRREDNDWGLDNPKIDMEGLAANVLFNHLVYEGDLTEIDEETKDEIKSKLEQYDEIQYRYKSIKDTASKEELESLEDESIDLLNQIEELKEEGADVYSIIPSMYRSYNNTYSFEVIGLRGQEYLVGLYDDMYEAAIENTEQLLDDVGTEGLSKSLLQNNLDKKQIRSEMEEYYEDDIRESPESYFDSDDYELTDEQEERKEQLENYINEMEDLKTEKEEELENTEDEDIIADLEREIEEIEENIEKAQDELDSIVPDDEPTEEMIEKMVSKMVRGRDEDDWLEELGRDLKDYVNMRGVAEDIVDNDGIATMSSYDGKYEDVYITGPDGTKHNFVIVRTN
jgi:predicted  nucleic acid-binding Zn-ribbon protein